MKILLVNEMRFELLYGDSPLLLNRQCVRIWAQR